MRNEKDGGLGDRHEACDRLYKAQIEAINHRQVKYSGYTEPRLKPPVLGQLTAFNYLRLR
jgi:hypothetical protein